MERQSLVKDKYFPLLPGAMVFNLIIYSLGQLAARHLPLHNISCALDDKIPLLPWMLIFYFGCYVFWFVNYTLSFKYDTSGKARFIKAHYIGETICLIVYLLYPTTMERAVISGTGIFDRLLALTYSMDDPTNLCPSIHCFGAWMCWIGIRGNRSIPKWYRIASLIFAVCVCISTLTVKQHVLADVPAGILLAEGSYLLSGFIIKKQKA